MLGLFRQLFLSGVVIKDRGTILRPAVGKLPVGIGGVDLPPEDVQEIHIRNLRWVIPHLHRLAVAGLTDGDFLITWLRFLAARVAGDNVNHAT